MSSAVGCALIDAGHAFGWPVAKGGSRCDHGCARLGPPRARRARSRRSGGSPRLPSSSGADVVASTWRPGPSRRSWASAFRPGSLVRTAATATAPARSSSTSRSRGVCPGRTRPAGRQGPCTWSERFEELVIAERAINRGTMPERPFVLVGQQYLADPGRSQGDLHPVWVYAHVPSGYSGDAERVGARPDRALRPGLPRADRGEHGARSGRSGGLQRQLRRRRHHHRGEHAGSGADQAAAARSIRTAPASPASTSAPPRRRREPGRTG